MTKPRKPDKRHEQQDGLSARTWPEVAEQWFRISGQRLSHARVWQICRAAERKMREGLKESELCTSQSKPQWLESGHVGNVIFFGRTKNRGF